MSHTKNQVIYSDILSDLDTAQRLLSNVYHYAQDIKNDSLERSMSIADSCIIEALENLKGV